MKELTTEEIIQRFIRVEERIVKVKKRMAWRKVKCKLIVVLVIVWVTLLVLNHFWRLGELQIVLSAMIVTIIESYYQYLSELEKIEKL